MAKLGIDGPLRRQGDIFGAALPQGAGQLGNYAAEDPGFGDHTGFNSEVHQEEEKKPGAGMEAILDNPYVSPSASSGGGVRGRVKKNEASVEGYGAAKVGMWLVYISYGILIGVTAFLGLLSALGRFAPKLIVWLAETGGPVLGAFLGITLLIFTGLTFLSMFAILVGQVCCIFSPNKDEKLFAGLAVGAIVLAFLTILVIFLMGMLSGMSGASSDGAKVALGLFAMLGIFVAYGLMLANLFLFIHYFRRVGKNISSKKVVKSSKAATMTCILAIALGIISTIVLTIVFAVFKDKPDAIRLAADISLGLNALIWFTTTGNIISMVKTTLDVLKAKS